MKIFNLRSLIVFLIFTSCNNKTIDAEEILSISEADITVLAHRPDGCFYEDLYSENKDLLSALKKDFLPKNLLINKKLEQIDSLDLIAPEGKNAKLTSLKELRYFKNLKHLRIKNYCVENLEDLKFLSQLKSLDLSYNEIDDISDLKALENLEKLNLESNSIYDISPLSELVKLKELNLKKNTIGNVSGLASLVKLEELDLSQNPISEIQALKTLRNLKFLDIKGNNRLEDRYKLDFKMCILKNINMQLFNYIKSLNIKCDKDIDELKTLNLALSDKENPELEHLNGIELFENLEELSLKNQAIVDLHPTLKLQKLKKLDLEGTKIKNLDELPNFNSLKTIVLPDLKGEFNLKTLLSENIHTKYKEGVSDMSKIKAVNIELYNFLIAKNILVDADIKQTKKLNLNNEIESLEGLEYFENLEKIRWFYNDRISDLSPLSHLENLECIDTRDSSIKSISCLSNLTKLKELCLNVSFNFDGDLSVLKNFKNLEELTLRKCNIQSIESLKELTNLKRLSIGENQIKDISVLGNLKELKELYISDNQIEDISILKDLTELTTLYVKNNLVKNLSVIKSLSKLNTLRINGNPISKAELIEFGKKLKLDIKHIDSNFLAYYMINDIINRNCKLGIFLMKKSIYSNEDIKQTKELNIDRYYIESLEGLEYFENLEKIISTDTYYYNYCYSKISDLSPLSHLENLECIDLRDSSVKNISCLSNLTKLKELHLTRNYNFDGDLSALKNLKNLEDLALRKCNIKSIESLKELTNLKTLYIGENQIKDISILKDLTKLTTLHVNDNQVKELSVLKSLRGLERLTIKGNKTKHSHKKTIARELGYKVGEVDSETFRKKNKLINIETENVQIPAIAFFPPLALLYILRNSPKL